MKAVAVTGSFGAGKTSVLKFARSMGVPALNTDDIVAGLYLDRTVKAMLLAAFGTANRSEIASIAFSSPKKRKKLESILHPMVWRSVEEWLEEMRNSTDVAFVEVPLLFEARWEKRFDAVVVVKAPRKKCLARLAAKGVSKREALLRLKAQLSLKKKVKKAQFIIDNGNAPAETRAQVKSIVEKLVVWRGMERVVIYPGTFDPVTFGHLDVIERALELFDRVIVAVATKSGKRPLLSLEERLGLLKKSVSGMKRVEVEAFSGLLVDYAKKKKARVIIRGLRELSDFEVEFQQATVNRKLSPSIETVFVVTNPKFFYLNSTMVKEIAAMHGNIECFVPKHVETSLRKKFC